MSLRQSKLLCQIRCCCKLNKLNVRDDSSLFATIQRRFFNIHEKTSGKVEIGVLGAPIQSGQV